MSQLTTRKTIRISEFNYSSNGAYFVTLCTKDRRCILSDIVYESIDNTIVGMAICRPHVVLTSIGECVNDCIKIANKENVEIKHYIIMPNHVHMIVCLLPTTDDRGRSSLQQIIKNIKSFTTKSAGYPLWQSRFYEHIIRNRNQHQKIIKYIHENPLHWREDRYYAEKLKLQGETQ